MKEKNIIANIISVFAEKYPDKVAITFPEENISYTYYELNKKINIVCKALIANNISKNDKIGLWIPSIPEWFIMFFAINKIGAISVPINTSFKEQELEYIINTNNIKMLIMNKGYASNNYNEIIKNMFDKSKSKTGFITFENIITVGFDNPNYKTFEKFIENGKYISDDEVNILNKETNSDDVCLILPTSGTTGFPKGVMLRNNALIKNGFDIGERLDLDIQDNMLIQVPMFHCFGITLSMMSSLTHLTKMTVLSHFNAELSLKTIEKEKITVMNSVPTMTDRIIASPNFNNTDFSSLKKGIMAGANCYPSNMKTIEEKLGMKVVSVYGETEASPGCTMSSIFDDSYVRWNTVGNSLPNIDCKIMSIEKNIEVPIGVEGEFVVKGYNVMSGYYNNESETNKVIDNNGYLHTGDLAIMDEFGYYHITGRIKDIIIRGGENISPAEIERIINSFDGVISCEVIGVPDDDLGEEIMACIISDNYITENDIRSFMKDKCARYKIPKYINFVDNFPTNANGKVLKRELRKKYS